MWLPWIPWDVAALLALALLGAAVPARRIRVRRVSVTVAPILHELGLVAALYAVWQGATSLSLLQTSGADRRGMDVWRLERWLHLPNEHSLQALFVPHPALVRALDTYYAVAHVPALAAMLVWVYVCHRAHYPGARNTVAGLTGVCLLVQYLPVAPPRLLPATGMVDTGLLFGPSVYGRHVTAGIDQFSAMPSIHAGWALVVAAVVFRLGGRGWRWLGPLHAVATVLAVVVTGNHTWADCLVAGVAAVAAYYAQRAVREKLRARPAVPEVSAPVADAAVPGG